MGISRTIKTLVDSDTILKVDKARRHISEPLEKVVFARMEKDILSRPRPRAVGIIMDGNRRWARLRNADPWIGHRFGKEKVREAMEWCKRFKIRGLMLYAFSAENFGRQGQEIDEIMKLMKDGFNELAIDPLIQREGVRVRVIGNLDLLPEPVLQAIRTVEDISADHDGYDLTFCIAYGGRDEIVHAAKQIARKAANGQLDPETIDESVFNAHLYAKDIDDPDLIIRTSGEKRLSNFLPWQSTYAELHFSNVLWPAFTYYDFLKALRSYQNRERRIGK